MRKTVEHSHCHARILSAAVAIGISCAAANGAVSIIGTQYQQDNPYSEYQCMYHYGNYPTSCGSTITGCNVSMFLKNTGGGSVSMSNVTIAGYSLSTILKRKTEFHDANSIYFYWQDPPQDIFDVGEPVWYRCDPNPIPAGGVARVVVRLRTVPVTQPVSMGVITSAGTVSTTIPVNSSDPVISNVGFSADRTKVYLTWRRSGGAGPTTIKMDDVDVTAYATTANDASCNYATTVLSFATAIGNMSYHSYQGIYSDGKMATAAMRTWVNRFIYGTWGAKQVADGDEAGARAWVDSCNNRGVNAVIMNRASDGVADLMAQDPNYCELRDYGYVKDDNSWGNTPRMWFIDDEPDLEEGNITTGTGLALPPGGGHITGVLGLHMLERGEVLRAIYPSAPTTINIDGGFKPDAWYAYGQLADVLMVDSYYEQEMAGNHWNAPQRDPLYTKPTPIYAAAVAGARAAEPNPFHMILYSCEYKEDDNIWPFPSPASKRIQAYYSLAAGAKGMAYWWFKSGWPFNGLNDWGPEAQALWKEIGLVGVEIKTLQPQLVTSHPVDMALTPGTNVWAKALACGNDTLMLVAVNNNIYMDTSGGCTYTSVANATVTCTLPSWMTSSPSAFEVRASGLYDLATSQNGSALTVQLGTLSVTKMVVLTTNPLVKAAIQQRYDTVVRPGVCAFAPELCVNTAPSITLHPSNQTAVPGGSASFTIMATGTSPLSYQWQKNSVNLVGGGHYANVTTATLTISSADTNDTTNYRCVATNPYGTATSNTATLTLAPPTAPSVTQQPANQSAFTGSTATFTVAATGTSPLSYQWQKSLTNLTNGGHYAGATTATLAISSVDGNDAANYRCVVANSYGSVTSNEASLTVTVCSAPTFTNGTFEASTAGNPPVGWTTYVQSAKSGRWMIQTVTPPEGSQWMQVLAYNPTAYAGVRQNVTGLTAGAVYTISGSYYTNSGLTTASVRYNLSGNIDRANSTILASKSDTNWTTFSGSVTASGASLMLFLDQLNGTSSNNASAFDNIQVTGCGTSSTPTITLQPTAKNICAGANASFSVAATGSGTLTYQWQKSSTNLANGGHYSGCTTATLAISVADTNDAASYRCVVSNSAGSTTSNAAALTIGTATAITQQPSSQTTIAGGTATFGLTAMGGDALTYQWQKNQTNLSNAGHYSGCTTTTLTITGADGNDAANYRCIVTDACGSTTSNVVTLTISSCIAPTLLNGDFEGVGMGGVGTNWTGYQREPLPTTGWTIQTASPPTGGGLQYQQIANTSSTGGGGVRQDITGCSIGTNYTISGWMRTNSAYATCTVKCSPTASADWSTAVDLDPPQTTISNTWVQFIGTATATGTSMTIWLDGQTGGTGLYKAACFDSVAVICTPPTPTVIKQPIAQNICQGTTATFTVYATGNATLSYQWQKNSTNLANGGRYAGVTTATLAITGADTNDAANYRCVVTNSLGNATSTEATLSVKAATTVTVQPIAQNVCTAASASFSVAATGTGTLAYQWQKTNANLGDAGHYSGCTTATLTIASADTNDAANYRCVVSGDCGSATSNQAALTLKPSVAADLDQDCDVDQSDFDLFAACASGPAVPLSPGCESCDFDQDNSVDQSDFGVFQRCYSGENITGDPNCAN